jgi:chemotaxis protein histidine kinase CheA
MALKADVTRACRNSGTCKPVDLVHLSNQTMGDRALENEILEIFLNHAHRYVDEWKNSKNFQARKRAAHTLRGGAKGIGAWDLADMAHAAEAPGFKAIGELEVEIKRVCDYIRLLRRN